METFFSWSSVICFSPYPYSLGILIEWKPEEKGEDVPTFPIYPYSLGILIEWKQVK